jgi:hypothetical protein
MCYSDLADAPLIVEAELAEAAEAAEVKSPRPTFAPSDKAQLWLGGLASLVVLIVGTGIGGEEPVLLIPYAITVLPALAAATIRVSRLRLQGKSTSIIDSVVTFLLTGLLSFAFTVCLVIVLIAVMIIYGMASCFEALKGLTHP